MPNAISRGFEANQELADEPSREMKTLLRSLAYGILILVILVVAIAVVARYPWLLLIAGALLLVAWPLGHIQRMRYLKRQGFFVRYRGEGLHQYEELRDGRILTLDLPASWTEVGHSELFIPLKSDWQSSAPGWAAARRDEVFQRVISMWSGFEIHYPEDWNPPIENFGSIPEGDSTEILRSPVK